VLCLAVGVPTGLVGCLAAVRHGAIVTVVVIGVRSEHWESVVSREAPQGSEFAGPTFWGGQPVVQRCSDRFILLQVSAASNAMHRRLKLLLTVIGVFSLAINADAATHSSVSVWIGSGSLESEPKAALTLPGWLATTLRRIPTLLVSRWSAVSALLELKTVRTPTAGFDHLACFFPAMQRKFAAEFAPELGAK